MNYEVAIIGGSSAGLAAALTLGRAGRRTVVFDTEAPRNKPAKHAHNIFTRDGTPPSELLKIGREQLEPYTSVSLRAKKIVRAQKLAGSFLLAAEDGEEITAGKLILATGLVDVLPDIKGFSALWGTRIVHCPYCHGWEIKDVPVGLIIKGEQVAEMAVMVHHWNKDLRIFTNGPSELSPADRSWMDNQGIEVTETPVSSITASGEGVTIHLNNGTQAYFKAVYAKAERLQFNNELAIQLGCELSEEGSVVTDEMQATSVPGVFAAGDLVYGSLHQVSVAAAAGLTAAAACNKSLIKEAFEQSGRKTG